MFDTELAPYDVQKYDQSCLYTEKHEYFADHKAILMDYKRAAVGQTKSQDNGDFANDVARSICGH
jgi:hypothetical protein